MIGENFKAAFSLAYNSPSAEKWRTSKYAEMAPVSVTARDFTRNPALSRSSLNHHLL
jgi:hypothetical protein